MQIILEAALAFIIEVIGDAVLGVLRFIGHGVLELVWALVDLFFDRPRRRSDREADGSGESR